MGGCNDGEEARFTPDATDESRGVSYWFFPRGTVQYGSEETCDTCYTWYPRCKEPTHVREAREAHWRNSARGQRPLQHTLGAAFKANGVPK